MAAIDDDKSLGRARLDFATDAGDFVLNSGNAAVVISNNVTIDTEQGNADNAGNILLGTNDPTTAASAVSADAVDFTLTLNAATTGATKAGGAISLGAVNNTAGGQYLDALVVDAVAPGTDGIVRLNGSIAVDPQVAGDAITISSDDVRLTAAADTAFTFDTNATAANQAGNVNLSAATISATNVGIDLTIDTSSTTDAQAGSVQLGVFGRSEERRVGKECRL